MFTHLSFLHLFFVCSLCGWDQGGYLGLWRHVASGFCKSPDGMFDGAYVGSVWLNAAMVDRHFRFGYISVDTRCLMYSCMEYFCRYPNCGGYFLDKKSLSRHRLNVHVSHKN